MPPFVLFLRLANHSYQRPPVHLPYLWHRRNIPAMLSRLHSMALAGIEAIACEVEVDVASRGFANAAIVGLPDTAVKESLERVRAALRNSGFDWPKYKTVINLAPADIKKEGPAFDLAIALGMIFAGGTGGT